MICFKCGVDKDEVRSPVRACDKCRAKLQVIENLDEILCLLRDDSPQPLEERHLERVIELTKESKLLLS